MRRCTLCGHGEHFHFNHECAGMVNWGCGCIGFSAREMSPEELWIIAIEAQHPRGQIGDASVGDEYSEIRHHLGQIMEKASQ